MIRQILIGPREASSSAHTFARCARARSFSSHRAPAVLTALASRSKFPHSEAWSVEELSSAINSITTNFSDEHSYHEDRRTCFKLHAKLSDSSAVKLTMEAQPLFEPSGRFGGIIFYRAPSAPLRLAESGGAVATQAEASSGSPGGAFTRPPRGFMYSCVVMRPGYRLVSVKEPRLGDSTELLHRVVSYGVNGPLLEPGIHAFVRALSEQYLRVGIDKYEHMGCAAGHAWLSRGVQVIAAGRRKLARRSEGKAVVRARGWRARFRG